MSQSQFKFERKSGGVSRKLKQAGNVSKIREFELEKVNIMYFCILCLQASTVVCNIYNLLIFYIYLLSECLIYKFNSPVVL